MLTNNDEAELSRRTIVYFGTSICLHDAGKYIKKRDRKRMYPENPLPQTKTKTVSASSPRRSSSSPSSKHLYPTFNTARVSEKIRQACVSTATFQRERGRNRTAEETARHGSEWEEGTPPDTFAIASSGVSRLMDYACQTLVVDVCRHGADTHHRA